MPNGLVGFLSDNWRIPAYMFANQETNSHLLYYPLQRSTSKTDLKPVLVKKKIIIIIIIVIILIINIFK